MIFLLVSVISCFSSSPSNLLNDILYDVWCLSRRFCFSTPMVLSVKVYWIVEVLTWFFDWYQLFCAFFSSTSNLPGDMLLLYPISSRRFLLFHHYRVLNFSRRKDFSKPKKFSILTHVFLSFFLQFNFKHKNFSLSDIFFFLV